MTRDVVFLLLFPSSGLYFLRTKYTTVFSDFLMTPYEGEIDGFVI